MLLPPVFALEFDKTPISATASITIELFQKLFF